MGDQAASDVREVVETGEATECCDTGTNKGKVDETQVESGHVVEQNGKQPAEHTLAIPSIAFVECRAERAGRFERLSLATQPLRQHKRADDTEGQIRRHPKLVTRATLAGMVACGQEKGKLADTVGDCGGETDTNQPLELGIVGVGHKRLAHDKNDGDSKDGYGEQDGVETQRRVHEARESLGRGHLLDLVAPKTKLELESRVNSTNSPSGSLLEMTTVVFRDSAELEGFVDERSLPALAQKHGGRGDVFGEGAKGKVTDLLQSLAANNVSGTCAPCDTESILDRLNDVNEEIQALRQGV